LAVMNWRAVFPVSPSAQPGVQVLFSLLLLLFITSVQGIYNYVPETNHVSSVYNVSAVLYLQSVLHVMLFRT